MPINTEKWEQEQIEKGYIPDKNGMWYYKKDNEQEIDCHLYEQQSDYRDHCIIFEPTYNKEDGSM